MRRLTAPFKGWVQRFALGLLVAAAIGLMILGKTGAPIVERLRLTISDTVVPALDALSRPVASARAVIDEVRGLVDLRSENARLQSENERLRHWQVVARKLDQENTAIRGLLAFAADPRPAFITARVVADSGGAFVRTALINVGADRGVRNGQAVIDGGGLVGRVVERGNLSARVLLLTDLNSRIPVVVELTRVRAILAGDNTDLPRLTFLPDDAGVVPGDRIVTSGHGGALPPGLPVGVVTAVDEGVVRVQPFVDWHRLEYVRVLDYALLGALPSTRPAGRAETLR